MPSELIKKIDLDKLYMPFVEKYLQLLANCDKKGSRYYAISGTRTFAEQGELYAQGRTKPGDIVTKAKPGWSAHNYGVAGDSCKDKDVVKAGLQPDWNLQEYKVLAVEAEALGLEAAFNWKSFQEGPHVQLPLSKYGLTFPALLKIHDNGGIPAVWKHLDGFKW